MRRLLFGLLFISSINFFDGNNLSAQNLTPKTATEQFNTSHAKSYTLTAKPEIFETSFLPGTEVNVDTVLLKFYSVDIGNINIETGRIIACEPGMASGQYPFITQFPVGQFPVQLAIAKVNNNEIVGFSRILFSNEPVKNWEFALKEGQKPIPIFGDSMYYYPVDGGLGQFIDESSFNKFEKLNENSQSQTLDSLFAELNRNSKPSWQYANTNYKDINIVAFTSGFGDGRYSTYIGYDRKGKPCRLLTDFGLVDWPKK